MSALRGRVADLLREGRADLAFDALTAAWLDPRADLQTAVAARTLLPHVRDRLPACAFGGNRCSHAERLGLATPTPRSAAGRLEFPAVSGPRGGVVRVDAVVLPHAPEDLLPEGLSVDTEAAIRAALRAARRGLPPADVTRRVRVAFDLDPPPQGPSCGLAVALAVRSALCRLPIDDDLAATGEVAEDGAIRPVSDMTGKLRLHRDARPAGRLLVPRTQLHGDEPGAVGVLHLDDALLEISSTTRDLARGIARDIDRELTDVRAEFRGGNWDAAARHAERLAIDPALQEGERAELLLILLAAANHRGDQGAAQALRGQLQPLVEAGGLSASLAAKALANLVVTAIDRFAVADADATLAAAAGLTLPPGDEGWLHLRGAEAALAVLRGDFARALALRRQNADAASPTEQPRCLGDLADTLRRCGHLDEAEEALRRAFAALDQAGPRRLLYKDTTRRFLHLHAARLSVEGGDQRQAAAHLREARGAGGPELMAALEAALLAATRDERLRLIDAALPLSQDAPIFVALRARARHLAGAPEAAAQLAACMGSPGVPVPELCRRLPY